jgi:hypothetical protein
LTQAGLNTNVTSEIADCELNRVPQPLEFVKGLGRQHATLPVRGGDPHVVALTFNWQLPSELNEL